MGFTDHIKFLDVILLVNLLLSPYSFYILQSEVGSGLCKVRDLNPRSLDNIVRVTW